MTPRRLRAKRKPHSMKLAEAQAKTRALNERLKAATPQTTARLAKGAELDRMKAAKFESRMTPQERAESEIVELSDDPR